jgi:hypothetical protein
VTVENGKRRDRSVKRTIGARIQIDEEGFHMKMHRIMLWLLVIAELTVLPLLARAQSTAEVGDSPGAVVTSEIPTRPNLTYTRPTGRTKLRNYIFDSIGPYAIVTTAFSAGIDQAGNSPPEWKQGGNAFGKRFASDFGISEVSTTTRYVLANVLKEDTLYYRCECKGVFPRLGHAAISTVTARRGEDGHRAFSVPSLVAPYAGEMVAVYGWYPSRFGTKDAIRMGNYSLLESVGMNIVKEFLFSGHQSRVHRRHAEGAPAQGSNL